MKQAISTDKAPGAIGPYSQCIKANGFLFLSGQVALDPASGKLVAADIRAQSERVLENLRAVLEAAGSSMEKVVRTTVFLADLHDFNAMNEVYARYFPADPPARSTVQAARLPRDAKVEIDVIALAGD
ncbi:MAG TPA: RidA family protein [Candidatus Xenobia bacterium]|nr:RidA family protein [Candidatus Xenobia bacterium]